MAWVENKIITFDALRRYTVYPISDFQLGGESCDVGLVKRIVKYISKDPYGMPVILGDIEDDDRPTTRARRKQAFADREEVLDSEGKKYLYWLDKEIIPLLLPLAQMPLGILGILAGHHWRQITSSINSVEYICNRLKTLSGKEVPYLGQMSAWIWMRFRGDKSKGFGRQAVTKLLHIQHGEGGGQALGSALNKLERTAQGFPADAYIRAHDCRLVSAKTVEVFPKNTEGEPQLACKNIALLNIGSATRGYNLTKGRPDYVEQGMMRPLAMGWGELHMDLRKARKADGDLKGNIMLDFRIEI